MFSGQVIKVEEPLPNLSENQLVWSNHVSIRKTVKNGTINYALEFAHPAKGSLDDLVVKHLSNAIAELSRQP